MEEIGVMAVVKDLAKFQGDMGKVDSTIKSLIPGGNLLQNVFQGIGDVATWLANSALHVLEYTLGSLLADAIEAVIQQIQQLISDTIQAGQEFQALNIRLQNFNMNDALKSTDDYTQAQKIATAATKEELTWLQKLAAQTPYDATDIANVYTLARSYGFADQQSRTLTESITAFAAGMGLGNQEIQRIIVNFGQMEQQGKVTQREMNDLARGSFVPVNDILMEMQKQTGLTGDAFDKFRNTGEGVQAFMNAFISLTATRFAGSTEAMARTWEGATNNIQDFVKSILGLDVVKPVLDALGGYVADFLNAFMTVPSEYENAVNQMEGVPPVKSPFDQIVEAAQSIGRTISGIIIDIFGLGPSAETAVQAVVRGFQRFADWLAAHRKDIVEWVKGAMAAVQKFAQDVSNWIQTVLVPAFERITGWIHDHQGQIDRFFGALGQIAGDVFQKLFGGIQTGNTDFLGALLDGLSKFMEFVINNKDAIASWIALIIQVVAIFSVFATVVTFVGGIIGGLVSFVVTVVLAFASLVSIVSIVGTVLAAIGGIISSGIIIPIIAVIAVIGAWIAVVVALVIAIATHFDEIKSVISQFVSNAIYLFQNFNSVVQSLWASLSAAIFTILAGIVQSVIASFTNIVTTGQTQTTALSTVVLNGLGSLLTGVIAKMVSLYNSIVSAFNNIRSAILSIGWVEIGVNIIQGIISGITSMIGSLVSAAENAAQSAANAMTSALGIASPSKVFAEIGKNVILGLAQGIMSNSGIVMSAMQGVSAQLVFPAALASQAAPSQSISNVTNAQQYNLSIHTSAAVEPIISDFNMLQALSG